MDTKELKDYTDEEIMGELSRRGYYGPLYKSQRQYALSDGIETLKTASMTNEEYKQAQKDADAASDGNLFWYPVEETIHARGYIGSRD